MIYVFKTSLLWLCEEQTVSELEWVSAAEFSRREHGGLKQRLAIEMILEVG